MQKNSPSYALNMLVLLRISKSRSAKLISYYLGVRKEFFEYVTLGADAVETIAEGDEKTAEAKVAEVFPYGWLDPNGKFVPVPISEHEKLVKQFTGYPTCDAACKAGWIKFTAGIPCDHNGECLFEEFSDRRRLSGRQKVWLDKWLLSISDPESAIPIFE